MNNIKSDVNFVPERVFIFKSWQPALKATARNSPALVVAGPVAAQE